jgi:AmmeMemoRadiSam system protein B
VVLFGAVHRWGVAEAALYGAGAWRTPLGDVPVDEELAQEVLRLAGGAVVDAPDAHEDEHSIEVQLPILQHLYPTARILPVAMPPLAQAAEIGRVIARAALGRTAVAVGSSDLTHYGPRYGNTPAGVGAEGLAWTRANDKRLIDLAVGLRVDEVVARRGVPQRLRPGALAARMAFSAELGATRGLLLHYTTSYESAAGPAHRHGGLWRRGLL